MRMRFVALLAGALLSSVALADVIKTVQIGATDQTVTVYIFVAADGTCPTGITYDESGMALYYWRHGANSAVAITEATQTVNGAHADGGFVELTAATCSYRLDLPDAAVASGATGVEIFGTLTSHIVKGGTVQLVSYNPNDAVRLGLTALPNAAAEASGGLYTRGTGAGQINQAANGQIDANTVAVSGDATAADNWEAILDLLAGSGNGAFPQLGISASGTAQAYDDAGPVTLSFADATAAADDAFNQHTVLVWGSNEADVLSTCITDYAATGDVATLEAALPTEPTGTIRYVAFATVHCEASGASLTAQNVWEYATRILTAGTNIELADQTFNLTGNVSGSVGSVTGAVGSVTGAVGSVTGSVGSVTGAVGSVTGAVGSVTGNVGGDVQGNVDGTIGGVDPADMALEASLFDPATDQVYIGGMKDADSTCEVTIADTDPPDTTCADD